MSWRLQELYKLLSSVLLFFGSFNLLVFEIKVLKASKMIWRTSCLFKSYKDNIQIRVVFSYIKRTSKESFYISGSGLWEMQNLTPVSFTEKSCADFKELASFLVSRKRERWGKERCLMFLSICMIFYLFCMIFVIYKVKCLKCERKIVVWIFFSLIAVFSEHCSRNEY